jgi:hypothetical protein
VKPCVHQTKHASVSAKGKRLHAEPSGGARRQSEPARIAALGGRNLDVPIRK